ncbi:MAG: hypothetical protein EXR72_21785 [Myxococcales bacterium]|nr:hypothetical protein [Myxococcales bacterium]
MDDPRKASQNITLRIDAETIRKAKVLASRQGSSVSRLLARTIERLVAEDEAWRAAEHRALDQLERGFHLGGRIRATRDPLHER